MLDLRLRALRRSFGFCLAVAVGGCSGPSALRPFSTPATGVAGTSQRPHPGSRCGVFAPDFEQLVACQRADGTLRSFSDPSITWRVRYFVRYWQMPCGEAPTVDEGYVFHMVTGDLYSDAFLDDSARLAIRDAMFDGKVRCK
jgi:hypothetical protein